MGFFGGKKYLNDNNVVDKFSSTSTNVLYFINLFEIFFIYFFFLFDYYTGKYTLYSKLIIMKRGGNCGM